MTHSGYAGRQLSKSQADGPAVAEVQYMEGLASWRAKSFRDSFSEHQGRLSPVRTDPPASPLPERPSMRHVGSPWTSQTSAPPAQRTTRHSLKYPPPSQEGYSGSKLRTAGPSGESSHWLEQTGVVSEDAQDSMQRFQGDKSQSELEGPEEGIKKPSTSNSGSQEDRTVRVLNAREAAPASVFGHASASGTAASEGSAKRSSASSETGSVDQVATEALEERLSPKNAAQPSQPHRALKQQESGLSSHPSSGPLEGRATLEYSSVYVRPRSGTRSANPAGSTTTNSKENSAYSTRPGSADTAAPDKNLPPENPPLPESSLLAQLHHLQTIQELKLEDEGGREEGSESEGEEDVRRVPEREDSAASSALEAEEQATKELTESEPPTNRLADLLPHSLSLQPSGVSDKRVSDSYRSEDLESAHGMKGLSERSASLHSAVGKHEDYQDESDSEGPSEIADTVSEGCSEAKVTDSEQTLAPKSRLPDIVEPHGPLETSKHADTTPEPILHQAQIPTIQSETPVRALEERRLIGDSVTVVPPAAEESSDHDHASSQAEAAVLQSKLAHSSSTTFQPSAKAYTNNADAPLEDGALQSQWSSPASKEARSEAESTEEDVKRLVHDQIRQAGQAISKPNGSASLSERSSASEPSNTQVEEAPR